MISVRTEHPIAYDSVDHTHPYGVSRDNHVSDAFNEKLFGVIEARPMFVMDIGCAGGGFVRSLIDEGQVAVGIEGSDYCKINGAGEWGVIPGSLFTADVRRPFDVLDESGGRVLFDVVTAWEVLEHIEVNELEEVVKNIRRHLKPGGLLIGSISTHTSNRRGIEYHVTIRSKSWWMEMFEMHGFRERSDVWKAINPDWLRKVTGSFQFVLE